MNNTLRTSYINVRVEPKLKASAHRALKKVGMSTSDAITLFLHQVVLHQGLPFEVRVPNAETIKALKELHGTNASGKHRAAANPDALFSEVLGKDWK